MRGRNFVRETHGAVMVMTAILIAVLLGFCGLAIDVGHYMLVKNQLQNAADAGAMAGVRALFPDDMTTATDPFSPLCTTAESVATNYATTLNNTDNATTTLAASPQAGVWDSVNRQFVAGCSNSTNAVKVTTQRTDTPLFLMQVLGAVPQTIQASSVAFLTYSGGLKKGKGFPIAIGKKYAQEGARKGTVKIYLNDNNCDTGCWYQPGASASDFQGTTRLLVDNPSLMPAEKKGDPIYLNNGVSNQTFTDCATLYLNKTVYLPVVDTIQFLQSENILGFCAFKILGQGSDGGFLTPGDKNGGKKYIIGQIEPMAIAPGDVVDSSSGADFGLMGPPRMVF